MEAGPWRCSPGVDELLHQNTVLKCLFDGLLYFEYFLFNICFEAIFIMNVMLKLKEIT